MKPVLLVQKFTIRVMADGTQEKRTGLTRAEVDKVMSTMNAATQCTHTGPHRYPFSACHPGYSMIIDEE